MNKVVLIGRLTKDPELRYTQSQVAVATFTVAVNRPKLRDKPQEADFINVVVWRNQAENVKKYISKGSQIAIEGTIRNRSYDDKDNKKVYVTEVFAISVQFLDTKKAEEKPVEVVSEPERDPFADFGEEIMITDDDLPFE